MLKIDQPPLCHSVQRKKKMESGGGGCWLLPPPTQPTGGCQELSKAFSCFRSEPAVCNMAEASRQWWWCRRTWARWPWEGWRASPSTHPTAPSSCQTFPQWDSRWPTAYQQSILGKDLTCGWISCLSLSLLIKIMSQTQLNLMRFLQFDWVRSVEICWSRQRAWGLISLISPRQQRSLTKSLRKKSCRNERWEMRGVIWGRRGRWGMCCSFSRYLHPHRYNGLCRYNKFGQHQPVPGSDCLFLFFASQDALEVIMCNDVGSGHGGGAIWCLNFWLMKEAPPHG